MDNLNVLNDIEDEADFDVQLNTNISDSEILIGIRFKSSGTIFLVFAGLKCNIL